VASNPTWSPNTAVAQWKVILDSNGNVQQANTPGVTGSTAPSWATGTVGQQTQDGSTIWVLLAILATPTPPSAVASLPAPVFVDDADGLSPSAVLADMIAAFELAANRTLQPAQPERLLVDLYAYRESLVRLAIQYCGLQCLVAFAAFPALDYLGQLVGVARAAAQGAVVTLQFTLAQVLSVPFTIAAGTLVGTSDGQFQFATGTGATIPAGATTATVNATCTTPGSGANGYAADQVNVLLSPDALVQSVTNAGPSAGGTDAETDDRLRERIQAAPNSFSSAGPAAAYRFFALSASPEIVDVQVTSLNPGEVDVYILTGPVTQPAAPPNSAAIASAALRTQVWNALSADEVRPLTDTVYIWAVTEVDYQIQANIEVYSDADPTQVLAAANAAAQQWAAGLAARVQRDIVPEQLEAVLGALPGVYRCQVNSPVYTPLQPGQWANCTAINLTQSVSTEHS